jgi:hypothetical protein
MGKAVLATPLAGIHKKATKIKYLHEGSTRQSDDKKLDCSQKKFD